MEPLQPLGLTWLSSVSLLSTQTSGSPPRDTFLQTVWVPRATAPCAAGDTPFFPLAELAVGGAGGWV